MSVGVTTEDMIRSSLWGSVRGVVVQCVIYPLEGMKIRQQCSNTAQSSARIALELFQQEGISSLYRGFCFQLWKTVPAQAWRWPMMTAIPSFLEQYHFKDLQRQALTGLSIATVDALVTTPMETRKIRAVLGEKNAVSLKSIYIRGWRKIAAHWLKLSVSWVTFLSAQKYLRDQARAESKQPLSLPQLVSIGTQVALLVSIVLAPFDFANTLQQARDTGSARFFSRDNISKLHRGWPLCAASLVIHNVASIILIEYLFNVRSQL